MHNPVPQILLALLLAHLVADFPLQRDVDIERKRKLKVHAFCTHALIHAGLGYVLCALWPVWEIPAVIFVTHFLIDLIKEWLIRLGKFLSNRTTKRPIDSTNSLNADCPLSETTESEELPPVAVARSMPISKLGAFAIDQLLHLTVLSAIANWLFTQKITELSRPNFWDGKITTGHAPQSFALLCGAILAIWTGGYVIGIIVKPFQDQLSNQSLGLSQAGRLIGQMERLLVFAFVLTGQLSAVGFLVTAKSILRFSEVKSNQDRMQVEYVLIGTLMSITWAIMFGYVTHYIVRQLSP